MPELQDIVDELAARTGRAIDVEDRRFRLLAHSAHDGPVDAVRRDTILRRAATPDVVARLERLGVTAAREPVRLPAAPELGMDARICFPVRERDLLLGYAWVLDDPPVSAAETDRLAAALAPVGSALAAVRDQEDGRRTREQHALTALLTGDPDAATRLLAEATPLTAIAAGAGADLSGLRRFAGAGRALIGEHAGLAVAVVAGDAARRLSEPASVVSTGAAPGAPGPDVVAGRTPPGARAPMIDVVAGGATIGVGRHVPEPAHAARSHYEAVLALRVASAVPTFGPVASFALLGAHGLLAPLAFPADGASPPPPPAALAMLATAPDGVELLATLRAVLDAGDDVAGAAAHLHVHRSTLHRRLRRVEQLTGADLAHGRTRLELHAGLVLAELLGR